MSKVTRISKKEEEQFVHFYRCDNCDGEFSYAVGYPQYCPECGALFMETARVGEEEEK